MNRIGFLASVIALLAFGCERKQASPPASAPSVSEEKATVAFYLLADVRMTGPQAKKQALEDLVLADKPLLTEGDILFYDSRTCRVFIKQKTSLDICRGIPRESLAPGLRPLVVVVQGKRRFLAAIALGDYGFAWAEFRNHRTDLATTLDRFAEALTDFRLLSPWDAADEKDLRGDPLFLAALRGNGVLTDRVWGVAPKRTRDEVARLATESKLVSWWRNIWWLPKREGGTVPKSWKIKTITFCREAVLTTPSDNIIGIDGPITVKRIWLVAFDTSAGSTHGGGGWAHGSWCFVDDLSGEVRLINPPRNVKSVTVPGTDPLPARPRASEDQVRKAARGKLENITRVRFIESAECLSLAQTEPVWEPLSRFWLCEGTDDKGESRRIILADRISYYDYRGGKMWFEEGYHRVRRIVPSKVRDK